MMRRGFKSWCERVAGEYRGALGVPMTDALDPHALSDHLGVRVLTPQDVPELPANSLRQLTVIDRDSWSAVTISQSDVRLVILNSGHSQTRQANSLVHELAHIILNHASDEAQVSREGFLFRARFDKEQEERSGLALGLPAAAAGGIAPCVPAYSESGGSGTSLRRQRGPRQLAAAHDRNPAPSQAPGTFTAQPLANLATLTTTA